MQIVIDVKNQEIADKIIWFLKQIKGISFKKNDFFNAKEEEKWDYWNEKEIQNFGKVTYGLSSNDFDDEYEDYSKW